MDRIEKTNLPRPFIDNLDNVNVLNYRQQYQKFRTGSSEGARGEVNDAHEQIADLSNEHDIIGSTEDLYNVATLYRARYRLYREGNAFGAKGEITGVASIISIDHVRLLPVAQLSNLLTGIKKEEIDIDAAAPKNLHLHIGAGRLGLGLVARTLEGGGAPFVILQNCLPEWEVCMEPMPDQPFGRQMKLLVNSEVIIEGLSVVTNAEELVRVTTAYAKAYARKEPVRMRLLVISDDDGVKAAIARACRTWSCALGPGIHFVIPAMLDLRLKGPSDTAAQNTATTCLDSLRAAAHPKLRFGLTPWPEPIGALAVYCCENDHSAVDKLKETLDAGDVDVVCCMVDRICADRRVTALTIDVDAEPHSGELIVLAPPERAITYAPPPVSGKGVVVAKVEPEANYFCRRKLLVVNGMHTTLAFYTLCHMEPPPQPMPPQPPTGTATDTTIGTATAAAGAGAGGPGLKRCSSFSTNPSSHALMTLKDHTEEKKQEIWAWAVARLLIVVWEHDPTVIKHAHGIATEDAPDKKSTAKIKPTKATDDEVCQILLDYARTTLGRFDTVEDTTGRVLGGGVANRWQGRLKSTDDFLKSFKIKSASPLSQRILELSGVGEDFLTATVSKLCDDSLRFTGLKVEKTPKFI